MPHTKVLALILAGGEGSRMELLTQVRAKPALPFAGVYRLLDFPLSNCVHSGVSDVWVVEQFLPYSLNKHLANGRPWDLDRTYGGLQVLPPYTGTDESGWSQGNADAIYRNKDVIRDFAPDMLLVLSADHLYMLDYRRVVDAHLAHEADVTMVTTQVPLAQASRFGSVEVDDTGKVTTFTYKPENPTSDVVTTEVFVYGVNKLLDTLDELAAEKGGDAKAGAFSLGDFGHELLPWLVQAGRAYAFPLDGYWRDAGTIESYWQSHMDLLGPEPPLDLDRPDWPILTFGTQRLPAHIHATAHIENSLISPGSKIQGEVIRSVLGPGVVVAEGASVRDAILFQDTVVEGGATVECAILDSDVRVGAAARIGRRTGAGGLAALVDASTDLVLVGQGAHIPAGTNVPAGDRVERDVSEA